MSSPGAGLEPALDLLGGQEPSHNVTYGHELRMTVWLRNRLGVRIRVHSVSARLSPDEWARADAPGPMFHGIPFGFELDAGAHRDVVVTVRPPLYAQPWTNTLRAHAEYEYLNGPQKGVRTWTREKEISYVIIYPVTPLQDLSMFVSLVEPEDRPAADIVEAYLGRAGVAPYVALADSRPGCRFWEEKIEPAIRKASGVLVIWTNATCRRPDAVLREMRYARAVGTSVALFVADGALLPVDYPADAYEHVPFTSADPSCAIAEAIADAMEQWRKTGHFFS